MARLAAIELKVHAVAERTVVQVPEDVRGLHARPSIMRTPVMARRTRSDTCSSGQWMVVDDDEQDDEASGPT